MEDTKRTKSVTWCQCHLTEKFRLAPVPCYTICRLAPCYTLCSLAPIDLASLTFNDDNSETVCPNHEYENHVFLV